MILIYLGREASRHEHSSDVVDGDGPVVNRPIVFLYRQQQLSKELEQLQQLDRLVDGSAAVDESRIRLAQMIEDRLEESRESAKLEFNHAFRGRLEAWRRGESGKIDKKYELVLLVRLSTMIPYLIIFYQFLSLSYLRRTIREKNWLRIDIPMYGKTDGPTDLQNLE